MEPTIKKLKKAIQSFADERDWNQYHSPKNLAMAMSVEAAEVVEIFQWLTQDESKRLSKSKQEALEEELADTYIYLLKLASHYAIDLNKAAFKKLRKTAKKYPVSKSRGTNKKYTEL